MACSKGVRRCTRYRCSRSRVCWPQWPQFSSRRYTSAVGVSRWPASLLSTLPLLLLLIVVATGVTAIAFPPLWLLQVGGLHLYQGVTSNLQQPLTPCSRRLAQSMLTFKSYIITYHVVDTLHHAFRLERLLTRWAGGRPFVTSLRKSRGDRFRRTSAPNCPESEA